MLGGRRGTRPASSSTRCSAGVPASVRLVPLWCRRTRPTSARAMAARRAAGEPLQYIFGHWPFRELDLRVDPRVLIPRPETEQVVEVALGEARRLAGRRTGGGLVVVDAGTGSGAIALALANALGCRRAAAAVGHRPQRRRARGGGGQPAGVAWRHGGGTARGPPGAGELAGPAAGSAARSCRPRRLEPSLRHRRGVGRAGSRGAGGAPPGAGRRPRPGRCARAWPTWRPCWSRHAPGWADPGPSWWSWRPRRPRRRGQLALQLGYDEVRVEPDLAGRPRALVARLGA